MNQKTCRYGTLGVSAALALISGAAIAQPVFCETFKAQVHVQDSEFEPTDPVSWIGYVRITGFDLPSLFDSANVVTPLNVTLPLSFLPGGTTAVNFVFGQSQADIDAQLVPGVYQYNIEGGLLGPDSVDVVQPEESSFSQSVPAVVNWFELQDSFSPTTDFTMQLTPWSATAETPNSTTFFFVSRTSDSVFVYSSSFPAEVDTITIPADTLEAQTQYQISIVYSARNYTSEAAFGGTTVGPSFDRVTELTFTTQGSTCPGCPADYNQDGGVTGDDVASFFVDYENGAACGDVNQDGGITGDDVAAFFSTYEAGGC